MCLTVLTTKGFTSNFPHCYVTLAEKTVKGNLPLYKNLVFQIHAFLSHHRLDVHLLAMLLVFEYEKHNIIIYFTVKNLILLFAEVLCTDPYNIGEIAIIELRQK